jgi:hypothetical protein
VPQMDYAVGIYEQSRQLRIDKIIEVCHRSGAQVCASVLDCGAVND